MHKTFGHFRDPNFQKFLPSDSLWHLYKHIWPVFRVLKLGVYVITIHPTTFLVKTACPIYWITACHLLQTLHQQGWGGRVWGWQILKLWNVTSSIFEARFYKNSVETILSVKSIAPPLPPCYVQQTLCMIFLRYRVQVHIQWAYSICIRFKAVLHLDLPQVVLSQEEKETEHKAFGGAREACNRASKCERSKAREASTTCFACRKSNWVTYLWREASGAAFMSLYFNGFVGWRKWIISCALQVLAMIWHIYLCLWNWTSRKLSKYQSDQAEALNSLE